MKKLSEKMAELAAKKEQKRVEREAAGIEMSGADVAMNFSRLKAVVPVKAVAELIRDFGTEEGRKRFRSYFSAKNQKLLESIESQIDDTWLGRVADMLNAVPHVKSIDARLLSWSDWKMYGEQVGFAEDDIAKALRLIFMMAGNLSMAKPRAIAR